MKLDIDRHRLCLLLIYLLFSLLVFWLVNWLAPGFGWLAGIGLIVLVALSYEPLLKQIQQGAGTVARDSELHFFSVFIELNEKIHKLTEIDDVLTALSATLRERVKTRDTLFLIDPVLEQNNEAGEATEPTPPPQVLTVWKKDPVNYRFLTGEFCQLLGRGSGIRTYRNAEPEVVAAFEETNTGIAIPVVQGGRLLAVLMIGRLDDHRPCSEFELQMYSYLANQLSIIFDRIRIYGQVMRKTALAHAEKMQVMQSLSANIAHEMRTPLAGIRASISGIENYLPDLLLAYEQARKEGLAGVDGIRENHLQTLQSTPDRVKLMIDQANAVIDMLLMNLRNNAFEKLDACMAASCIEQAIERYPFKTGEREKVHLDLAKDFEFLGVEILFVYIMFNLLKNALYSIRSAQKGEIYISLQCGKEFNSVSFRDSGEGMEAHVVARVFDSFFTTKADGTGAGLAFCLRTMRSFGGDIRCESVYGEYTEFTLRLPVRD